MPTPLPTSAELAILQILWSRGPSTVREVHEAQRVERTVGYTSALKLLQIMHEKGLVRRDGASRAHIYTAAGAREQVERALLDDLAARAFGGSAERLVMRALGADRASPRDLQRIRALLRSTDEGRP
ncbi:MAG: BlaI/MecI/CopY family transcriptional regulator [Anaerolineae bacterium]|nr:BlaI/MecI/CopY family transcriptional regulator [Gemmatimonadaceae bacterium]